LQYNKGGVFLSVYMIKYIFIFSRLIMYIWILFEIWCTFKWNIIKKNWFLINMIYVKCATPRPILETARTHKPVATFTAQWRRTHVTPDGTWTGRPQWCVGITVCGSETSRNAFVSMSCLFHLFSHILPLCLCYRQ